MAADPSRLVLTERRVQPRGDPRGQGRADHPVAPGSRDAAMDRAALHLGAARGARHAAVRRRRDVSRARARRAAHHQLARRRGAADGREMGRRCRVPAQVSGSGGVRGGDRRALRALDAAARGSRGQQRRADRDRLPDRRGHRLHRQRRLLPRRGRDAAVPAAVRRARRRLAAAGIGVQAVQLRDRHQRRHDDRRLDVHGRHDDVRRLERLHAQELRPARARPDPHAQLAPVVAQHPGRQGAGHQRHASTCSTWRAASG